MLARLGVVLALMVFLAIPLSADVTGTISGIVRDPSGAVVPGAEITATNTGTGSTYNVVSDSQGEYAIRALPVGVYDLTVQVAGFKRFDNHGIRLQVNEIARVDVNLAVGASAEAVTVTAEVVNVDTTTPTLKGVIDQKRIEDLPLNGRNPTQLMRLIAGVETYDGKGTNDTEVTSGTTYPGVITVSVNGGRGNTTNYILDGGQNNDHYNNLPNPMPNPDALQEFSVQTNTFSAEFGRNVGGIVNAVTKSGTNTVHGAAFDYIRNYALNAANFFSPPKVNSPTEKQDDGLKRNQYGITVGGPVWIPKIYNGKDKTFFFFSYQGTRNRQRPVSTQQIVPTAAQRAGDFSSLKLQLKDPFGGGTYAGNKIPASHLNSVSQKLLDYVPLPQGTGNTLNFFRLADTNDDQILAKGDQQLGTKNRFSGRYWVSWADKPGFFDPKNYLASSGNSTWRNTSWVLSDTHIFAPSLVNTSLFSFNRTLGTGYTNIPNSLADLGVKIYADPKFPEINVSASGYFSIALGARSAFLREEYQVTDTLRWTKGRHQLSFGGDVSHGLGDNDNLYRTSGTFTFSSSAPFTGDSLADYMVGKFSTMQQGVGEFKRTRFNILSLFVEDSMHLTKRLTVDIGMRWDPFFPFTDVDGKLAGWRPGQQSTRFVNAPKNILFPGDPGLPDGGYASSWLNFGPRVGFAWDVTGNGKTSVRGGYGIFYDHPNTIATNSPANQAPFGLLVTTYGSSVNNFIDPYAGTVNQFPATTTPGKNVAFVLPDTAFVYDEHMRNAYIQSWNLTVEREVTGGFIGRISYAGSKGTRLITGRQLNWALYSPGATTTTTDQRRPMYPNFASVLLEEPTGNSTFHSMQLTAERRFSHGFSILSTYMFSKTLDDGSANKGTLVSRSNPYSQAFDHGPAEYDKTHVFNTSGLWAIPGDFHQAATRLALSGWKLTGILSLQSGPPFTVYSGVDNARSGTGYQRSDLIGNPILSNDRSNGEKAFMWINRSAFAPNALGTFGTQGRNMWRAAGRAVVDFGLHKDFKVVPERLTTQFRFEVFNALNRVNLDQPNQFQNSVNFLRITTAQDPRILQFALKVIW